MLTITDTIIRKKPFPYFYCFPNINNVLLEKLRYWFEKNAPWNYVETDFYEQYEFNFKDVKVEEDISYFVSKNFQKDLLELMHKIFSCKFHSKIDIVGHKLVKGQKIGIHNDFLENEESETHRLLLQINLDWDENQGGFLMFFDDTKNHNISDVFIPINGSLQGFAISKKSHHAVSTIYSDKERYTIIYNFYALSNV